MTFLSIERDAILNCRHFKNSEFQLSEAIWLYHKQVEQTEATLNRKLQLRDLLYYTICPIFPSTKENLISFSKRRYFLKNSCVFQKFLIPFQKVLSLARKLSFCSVRPLRGRVFAERVRDQLLRHGPLFDDHQQRCKQRYALLKIDSIAIVESRFS